MTTREEYESALRGIVMLADAHGGALNKGFRIMGDGALIGPHGVELERAMVDRDRSVRQGLSRAFDQVKWLSEKDLKGPLPVAAPRLGAPPVGSAKARAGVAGGDVRLLDGLHAEFGRAGRSWREAAARLDRILVQVGADRTTARTLDSAGEWLISQQPDLLRRRADLLRSDQVGLNIGMLADAVTQSARLAVLTAQLQQADPRLAAELQRAGVDLSTVPPQGDPRATADWWKSLTDRQHELYIKAFPQVIGWLDGLPAPDRDRANRLVLTRRIDELQARSLLVAQLSSYEKRDLARLLKLRQRIDALDGMAAAKRGPEVFLLGLDTTTAGPWDGYGPKPDPFRRVPGGEKIPPDMRKFVSNSSPGPDGRIILALGNPDKATHTGVYIPGTTTKLDTLTGGDIDRIKNLWSTTQRFSRGQPVSTIAWLGYDAPDSFTDAASGKYAERGGPALDQFVNGVRAAQGEGHRHLTMVGHSYGSTVIGEAARVGNGLNVDDIVVAGSPGMRVPNAQELHMDPSRVWSELAAGDPVADLGRSSHGGYSRGTYGTFPIVPSDESFGAQRLVTDTRGHSDYWASDPVNGPTLSLLNQAKVVAGTPLDQDPGNDPRIRF